MRNAKECLAMAVDIERQAGLSDVLAYRADLLSMAQSWRHLAQQALWQDCRSRTASPR
jgi:hypothetical protein